jgi:hypothetical protein
MAYTVLPKENPARNNKHQSTVLERRTDDELIGPDLHWSIDWHPITKEWWDEWRRSEIAVILEPSDWKFLQDTALIHHRSYNDTRTSIAQVTAAMAEIRQRVAKFGATLEDRLKLRIKFAETTTAENKAAAGPAVDKKINYRALVQSDDS